jgi:hypothetical protein
MQNNVCDGLGNINAKVTAVGDDVNTSVNSDPDLKAQRDGTGHPNGTKNFKYLVGKAGTGTNEHVVLVIEGKINDGQPGNQPAKLMKNLAHLIQKNVKRGCLSSVWFVKPGTLPITAARYDFNNIEGFEWSACEWPNVPCSDGSCSQACLVSSSPTPDRTPAPNTNKSMNSNSNTNSNRPGNS